METRIIFLRKFTANIIKELIKENKSEHNVEVAKIKKKFIPEEVFKDFIRSPYNRQVPQKPIQQIQQRQMQPQMQKVPIAQPPIQQQIKPVQQKFIPVIVDNISGVQKINPLLNDRTIQLIECPGPGKNLLVKRYNHINMTKIVLSQEQITEIINDFADKAKIPIINGILKAAVENVIISAVISNFVGSRFIINKTTSYNFLE